MQIFGDIFQTIRLTFNKNIESYVLYKIYYLEKIRYLTTLSNIILLFKSVAMTYKTSRNFDHLTTTPTPEYRAQQRLKAEEIFSSFKNKRENREDYLSDPKVLKEALDEYEKIQD